LAAAGASFAQSSVTVFGTFDPSIANAKTTYANGNSVTQNFVRNNSQGTSQISFKGVEDLGGGLKATFLLENDFDAAKDATSNFSSKGGEQYAGLEGGFGSVKLGAANTPTLTAQASRQPIGTKIGSGFGATGVLGTAHVRNNNSVVYATPAFSGFSAAVGYAFKTKNDAYAATAIAPAGDIIDLGLNYANGPFRAGVSNYRVAATPVSVTPVQPATGKNVQTNLYAQYDIAGATLYAGFHAEKTDNATGTAKVLNTSGFNVAVKYALTPAVNLLANYGSLNDKLVANADKTIAAIGAQYALSKRTSLYTRYVSEKNDNVTGASIKKVQTALVGVQHNF
jgi:predicted porin